MQDWFLGQKIVCVNGNFGKRKYKENLPKKDSVYTIRDVDIHVDKLSFLLEEIINIPNMYSDFKGGKVVRELRFLSNRFKPLEKDLSHIDISIFENILKEITKEKILESVK
jgi:hypothetical protein